MTTPLIALAQLLFTIFVFFYTVFLCLAGGCYWLVWSRGQTRFAHRRIQAQPRLAQPWRELYWSTLSIMILSALLTFTWRAAEAGWSRGYFELDRYGWGYLAASVLILALLHDSDYYWAHRAMHHRRLFQVSYAFPNSRATQASQPLNATNTPRNPRAESGTKSKGKNLYSSCPYSIQVTNADPPPSRKELMSRAGRFHFASGSGPQKAMN
jgi:hypothetical protein